MRTSNNFVFENDDILMEILLRLPMEVRVLCKAVCKRWFSLISSSWFAKCVLSRKNNPPWDFLYKLRCSEGGLQVAFGHYPELNSQNLKSASLFSGQEKIQLLDVDSGLILCAKCEFLFWKHSEYFVCNPITGQLVSLPKPQVQEHVFVGFRVSCYNGITTYKVVRAIVNDNCRSISNFDVFSSDVGEWRNTAVSWPAHDVSLNWFEYDRLCGSVNYKGIFHWLLGEDGGIIAYDPDRNKLRIIKMPSNNLHRRAFRRIGLSCGHLCYIDLNLFVPKPEKNGEMILSIWVLNNYDMEKWCLVHKIDIENVLAIYQIHLHNLSFVFHPFDIDVVYMEAQGKTVTLKLQTQKERRSCSIIEENVNPRFHFEEGLLYPYVFSPLATPIPQPIWEKD